MSDRQFFGRTGEMLLSAARLAMGRHELDLAESLARSARYVVGGWPVDQVLAEILAGRGRYAEAAGVLPGPPPAGTPARLRLRWATTAASVLYWDSGDVDAADRILGAVGEQVADAHRAWVLLLDGRCRAALTTGGDILSGQDADPEAVILAAAATAISAGLRGQVDLAMAACQRGRVAARRERQLPARARLGYANCLALLMAGRLDDASTLAGAEYHHAVRAGVAAVAGGWSALSGLIAKTRGDIRAAIEAFHEAIDLLGGHDADCVPLPCFAELAGARAMSGDRTGAEVALRQARRGGRRIARLMDAWVELDRAWAMAADGDISSGAKQARRAAALAGATDQLFVEAIALYDAARLGDSKAVRHRLTELVDHVDVPMVRVMARAAGALADADPQALDQVGTTFAQLGLNLHAAEVATTAAALHRRSRSEARANRSTEKAAEARRLCPGAVTPLLRLAEPFVGLTGRERDVALLAATGLTSSSIAGRLRLSVRTVDNYLGRVYVKLGIASRRDLAQVSAMGRATTASSVHRAPMSASSA